jgi:hypothetical protein
VQFTNTSDCQLAREILLRVAKKAIGEYLVEAQTSWKAVSDNYRSANPPLEPTVTLIVNAGSLEFTVSYVVDHAKRTAMKDQLFTKMVEEVANSYGRIEWTSSPTAPVRQSMTPDPIEMHPSSSTHGSDHLGDSH